MRLLTFLAVLNVLPAIGFADTIHVPADQPTIQAGIDAAANGDTVLVAPGTYMEIIDFLGKAITLKSSDGATSTVIDANQGGRVVTFRLGEGPDSVLDGFTIFNGFIPVSGGGIVCRHSSSPTIKNNTITGNSADYGAGISCGDSSPTITNNLITGNSANKNGGGISCGTSSSIITDNIITGNSAIQGGGGVVLSGEFSQTFMRNIVAANSADYGGGIYCGNSTSTIKNNTILWNLGYDGGGIYCDDTTRNTTIENNTLTGNSAYRGGGIFCTLSSPNIENNTITGNTADDGGGIYCKLYSSPAIIYNTIFGNSSVNGGGLYCITSSPTVESNLINGNSATYGGGIGCFYQSSPALTNNTIFGNSADNGGGIYCFKRPTPIVTNVILWENTATIGPEISLDTDNNKPTVLTISHSTVKGGQSLVHVEPDCTLIWGEGMIEDAPLFVDPVNNDFHLTFQSPCRDSGYDRALTKHLDFEGDLRLAWGETVDMGADEFYTHLYATGNKIPGGNIQVKLVGLPGTSPVYLIVGSGVRETPVPTSYGEYYLLPPSILIPLIPIPADGILALPFRIPTTPPSPYDVPMQGLVGLSSDSLTNLCVLEVR